VLMTVCKSPKVRVHFQVVGVADRHLQPCNVWCTRAELQVEQILGKYGSSC
jgi:hypothetical protein